MRNLGLDIMRSVAIILVLICHAIGFFYLQYYKLLGWLYVTGYLAVEIFFILSGFLIGKILIQEVYETGELAGLKRFYIRRWLRTLPLYFLVVFLLIIFMDRKPSWENFVFLQNFNEVKLNFMPVSWSLSIEEWFYLITPVIFLIVSSLRSRKKAGIFFVLTCTVLILVEFYMRCRYSLNPGRTWDFGVRKQVFFRLDSLMFGVLLVGIKKYYRGVYDFIKKSIFVKSAAICGLIYFSGFYLYAGIMKGTIDGDSFSKIFLFSIVSLCIAALLPSLESSSYINDTLSKRKLAAPIKFISLTSYSVYLIHFEIYQKYSEIGSKLHVNKLANTVLCILATVFIYAFAFALYKLYEQPIMNFRDRITSRKNVKETNRAM